VHVHLVHPPSVHTRGTTSTWNELSQTNTNEMNLSSTYMLVTPTMVQVSELIHRESTYISPNLPSHADIIILIAKLKF
jgi:hypothetical protein